MPSLTCPTSSATVWSCIRGNKTHPGVSLTVISCRTLWLAITTSEVWIFNGGRRAFSEWVCHRCRRMVIEPSSFILSAATANLRSPREFWGTRIWRRTVITSFRYVRTRLHAVRKIFNDAFILTISDYILLRFILNPGISFLPITHDVLYINL